MEHSFPSRKNTRLPEHDYSQPGYYFITICTAIRKQDILCSIQPQNVGAAALGGPQIMLTPDGKVVEQHIQSIDHSYHEQITVDQYVIMPDHIHLILQIHPQKNGSPKAATPAVAQVVNALKGLSAKKVGHPLWQRGYYDHIIRNDADLSEIRSYIQNNPLKECDCNG